MCALCDPVWKAHQHRMYVQRKARQKG
jgi:hypothetical protein